MSRREIPLEGFKTGTVLVQFRTPLNPDPTADPCYRRYTSAYTQTPECVVFMSVQSSGCSEYGGPRLHATYLGTVKDGSGRVVPANLAPYLVAEGSPWSKPYNTCEGTSTDMVIRGYYRNEVEKYRSSPGQYHLRFSAGDGPAAFTWDGRPRTVKELHAHLKDRRAKEVRC